MKFKEYRAKIYINKKAAEKAALKYNAEVEEFEVE